MVPTHQARSSTSWTLRSRARHLRTQGCSWPSDGSSSGGPAAAQPAVEGPPAQGQLTWQDQAEEGRGQHLGVAQLVGVAAASDVDAVLAQPVVLLGQVVQLLPDPPGVVREPVLPHVPLEEGQQGALLGREAQQRRGSHQLRGQEGGDDQVLHHHGCQCRLPQTHYRWRSGS